MTLKSRVLLVDGDTHERRLVHHLLLDLGCSVADVEDPNEAAALSQLLRFDAVLVNPGTQEKYGIEVCRLLRSCFPRATILVLGESNEKIRKIEALEAGADDYLSAPFDVRELVACMECIARRAGSVPEDADDVIAIGEIRLDPQKRAVTRNGEPVYLTPAEFNLLHVLMLNAGKPVTGAALMSGAGQARHPRQMKYLRKTIQHLREKLDDSTKPRYVLTDRRLGYRFTTAEALRSQ
jgi:two-component system KDP operon response regulator KdpE